LLNRKDFKIALLYGGTSKEREISIQSGKAIEKALKELGYIYEVFDPIYGLEFIEKIKRYNPDLAFIALHGKGGEDGQIQSILDFLQIKYTGSNARTSAICMDKKLTKTILQANNINTPKGYTTYNVNFPAVVKPAEEGSSIGVFIVHNKEELEMALSKLKDYKNLLIEEYIKGREITVAMLNGKVLPPIEIKFESNFYDFNTKYISSNTQYICPAPLTEKLNKEINRIAIKCWDTFECKGAIRIDMLIQDDNVYVLEINTIPGMTSHSLLPKAAEKAGINFNELVDKIIQGALYEKDI